MTTTTRAASRTEVNTSPLFSEGTAEKSEHQEQPITELLVENKEEQTDEEEDEDYDPENQPPPSAGSDTEDEETDENEEEENDSEEEAIYLSETQCRVCHDVAFVAPCECKGSSLYVHPACWEDCGKRCQVCHHGVPPPEQQPPQPQPPLQQPRRDRELSTIDRLMEVAIPFAPILQSMFESGDKSMRLDVRYSDAKVQFFEFFLELFQSRVAMTMYTLLSCILMAGFAKLLWNVLGCSI